MHSVSCFIINWLWHECGSKFIFQGTIMNDIFDIHHLICNFVKFDQFGFNLLLSRKSHFVVVIAYRTAYLFDHLSHLFANIGILIERDINMITFTVSHSSSIYIFITSRKVIFIFCRCKFVSCTEFSVTDLCFIEQVKFKFRDPIGFIGNSSLLHKFLGAFSQTAWVFFHTYPRIGITNI